MTQEEKRIKIAEACGWTDCHKSVAALVGFPTERKPVGIPPNRLIRATIPDYFWDLNACYEMEEWIINARLSKWWKYCDILITICPLDIGKDAATHAKAKYRAEAFGISMGLWKEGE